MPGIILIRHAETEDSAASGGDAARSLTSRGHERMTAAARGLSRVAGELTVIAHSPLVRAVQTAQIIADRFPAARLIELPALLPDQEPQTLLEWFAAQTGDVAVVGHEPVLSNWIGYAVAGNPRAVVHMKKSSACALEFPRPPVAGSARIRWFMDWRQLAAQA
ncbi:MAG: SixA phosphatase family protein [Gammaproteobacteria bacterium]